MISMVLLMRHLLDLDGQFDRAILQRSFGHLVPLAASLGLGTFDCIGLQKLVELGLLAPVALEIVVMHLAGAEIADGRVSPLGQLHGQAGGRTGEQFVGTLDGLRKPQTLTRRSHGRRVPDFRLDGNNMRHGDRSCVRW